MSNFNPNSKVLKPEEWRSLAAKNVIKEADSASRDFVISALLGLFAAGLTGLMPVGVGIVGCGIMRGWRKNNLMDERIKAIQMGCAAPFLDDSQLRRFSQQAGLDEALKQIHWAIEEDVDILPSAEDLYEVHGASMALPEAVDAIEVEAVEVAAGEPGLIGNATRLGAIEVPATVQPEGTTATQNTAGQNRGLTIVDLPRAMGQQLHPTIISAKPRIGKGMVVQSAWRWAKKLHPGITVWVIDPKPHPTERAYWQGVDRYWGQMIEDYPQNDEAIATELTEFIHEWRAQGSRPTLLIIDELVKLEAILPKWYKDFLIPTMKVEASSGETDQRFLWVIAQSPQVKDLGLSGGSRAVFDFLTLQRADSIDHAERVRASIGAIKSIPTAEEFASVPSGVAFWHSRVNRWGGVPLLEVPKSATVAAPPGAEQASLEVETKVEAIASQVEVEPDDGKTTPQRPDLSKTELGLAIAELSEWMDVANITEPSEVYEKWKHRKHGFSRPEIRFLLKRIEDL